MARFPSLRISLVVMGVSSISAQVLLLREFLVSFLGNELTFGILLANWMALEALGAFALGKSAERTERKLEVYVLLQLFFSVALPASLYLARIFKEFLGTTPGEALGAGPIFLSSLIVLFPVAVSHGALFTYGCKLYGETFKEHPASVGRVYILETVGLGLGGLLLTFLLLPRFHALEVALGISLANVLASIALLWERKSPPSFLRIALGLLCLGLTSLFLFLPLSSNLATLQWSSIRSQWKNLQPIHSESSIYGSITVTKRGEQYTFFTDGLPTLTTPVPDLSSIEDFVHFPMLFHECPRSILILGGGAGGVIHEILKHPVSTLDYVELDPLLLRLVQKFPTPLTEAELSDPRVRIHYGDARFFIRQTSNRFDLIFLGLSVPQDLRTNRLFSREFFSEAKARMNPKGVMVLTLPGSLTYMSPELRDLNGSIYNTLKRVFPHVRVIPGETHLYLAGNSEDLERVGPEDLSRRLEDRRVKTALFTRGYVAHRLNERWSRWFFESMEGKTSLENSDLRPVAVFFSLVYWNALFSPALSSLFKAFQGLPFFGMAGAIAAVTILGGVLWRRSSSAFAPPYSILTSGFAAMIFDLLILFSFQATYGYLYQQVGLLIATFMVGVMIASSLMNRWIEARERGPRFFALTELWVILFSLGLPAALSLSSFLSQREMMPILPYGSFFLLSFLGGTTIGFQFPLAAQIHLRLSSSPISLERTGAILYAADLLGGFLGGLLGGVLLFPLLGLHRTCLLVALLKAGSLVLLLCCRPAGSKKFFLISLPVLV